MKGSTIIYERAYKKIRSLPDKEKQLEAFVGLMEYGLYDKIPKTSDRAVCDIYETEVPSLRAAINRHDTSISNGKKGGRPTSISTEDIVSMKANGMTNKEIAEKYGCAVGTIANRIAAHKKALSSVSLNQSSSNPLNQSSRNQNSSNPQNQSSRNTTASQNQNSYNPQNQTSRNTPVSRNQSSYNPQNQSSRNVPFSRNQSSSNPQNQNSYNPQNQNVSRNPGNPAENKGNLDTQYGHSQNPRNLTNNIVLSSSIVESSKDVTGSTLVESSNVVFNANTNIGEWGNRRIRDLSEPEAKEIKAKLAQGVRYAELNAQYGMIPGTIDGTFGERWKQYLFAKVNGRVK